MNFGDGGGESSITNNTTTIDGGVGPSNTNSTTAGPDTAGEDGYKFGDVTRGLIGTIREKRQQSQYESSRTSSTLGSSSSSGGDGESGRCSGRGNYLKENKGRFAGVAGGTAGAAAGLVIAGPVGMLAGSLIGSMGSQVAVHKHDQEQRQQQQDRSFSPNGFDRSSETYFSIFLLVRPFAAGSRRFTSCKRNLAFTLNLFLFLSKCRCPYGSEIVSKSSMSVVHKPIMYWTLSEGATFSSSITYFSKSPCSPSRGASLSMLESSLSLSMLVPDKVV